MTALRTPPVTTARRPNPTPVGGTILHLIGDVHAGGIPSYRLDSLVTDQAAPSMPTTVAATIQLGDNTDNGLATEKAIYAEFKARLPGAVYEAMGNHDTYQQTAAQWAASLGHPDMNYTVDVADVRLIFLGGTEGELVPWSQLTPATLTYLDTQLTAAGTRPCFIACHYPLWDTVGGDSTLEYTSTQTNYFACTSGTTADSSDVLAVLAAHSNVKGWLSGHTHSSITVPGLVVPVVAGSTRFAHVNASCLYYCGKTGDNGGPRHPVHSSFLSWTGSSVEVRYRHHGAGQWYGPDGNRVFTVTGLG